MNVFCPQCGTKIPVEGMNLKKMSALCQSCQTPFSLSVNIDERGQRTRRYPAVPKNVRQPLLIRVSESPTELRIERPWFSIDKLFYLVIGLVVDGFLVGSYYEALITNKTIVGFPWPLLSMGVSVLLTYKIIQHIVNRTEIRVSAGSVTFADRPISLEPPQRLGVGEIDQVFCRQAGTGPNEVSSGLESFEVVAIDKAGTHHCMMRGLKEISHAQYIERRIETYLGITDRWVAGEYA